MTLIKKTNKWHDTRCALDPASRPRHRPGPGHDKQAKDVARSALQPKKKLLFRAIYKHTLRRLPPGPNQLDIWHLRVETVKGGNEHWIGVGGHGVSSRDPRPHKFLVRFQTLFCSYLLHFYVKCAVRYAILFSLLACLAFPILVCFFSDT